MESMVSPLWHVDGKRGIYFSSPSIGAQSSSKLKRPKGASILVPGGMPDWKQYP